MQKGLSEPALSSSPGGARLREELSNGFSLQSAGEGARVNVGRYFRGNLDRDKAESTQLPEEHNTWEIFAKKLRARSNSFRRHRFRTTSKVSIPKGRSPILARSTLVFSALNRTLPHRNDGAFILLRVGEECSYRTDPRRPRKRVLRGRWQLFNSYLEVESRRNE